MAQQRTIFGTHVIDVYRDGEYPEGKNRSNGNLYFRGDVLYSYGEHFELARRIRAEDGSTFYLVNTDRNSVTTAKHQSWTRGALRGEDHLLVNFGLLDLAGIDKTTVRIVDREPVRSVDMRTRRKHVIVDRVETRTRRGGWNADGHYDREIETTYEYPAETHDDWVTAVESVSVPGATLITARQWRGDKDEHYLVGHDETGRPIGREFLTKLVAPVATVADAYEQMMAYKAHVARAEGRPWQRQGEFFFVAADPATSKRLTAGERQAKIAAKAADARLQASEAALKIAHDAWFPIVNLLPTAERQALGNDPDRWDPAYRAARNENLAADTARRDLPNFSEGWLRSSRKTRWGTARQSHTATAVTTDTDGQQYARGTVRHDQGDHRPLTLGPGWWAVDEAIQAESWSVSRRGRADAD